MVSYSIIIPHRNSSELLKRLLLSIPDVDDIEVIVIDNNSSEQEKHELQEMEINKNVSIYYDLSCLGAGRARNIGLEKANGKWLIFADADDYFSENMYILLQKYNNAVEDIIYFGTYSIYNDSLKAAYRHVRYVNLINDFLKFDKEDALRYYFTPPWAKMIKRKLVVENNLKFDEVIASNDIYFSISVAHLAKEICATEEVLYNISVTSGSLTNSFSREHFDARLNVALKANDFLRSIRKNKYQISVLYYLVRSYKFGFNYTISVLVRLITHRSNLLVGIGRFLKYKDVMKDRENSKFFKRDKL